MTNVANGVSARKIVDSVFGSIPDVAGTKLNNSQTIALECAIKKALEEKDDERIKVEEKVEVLKKRLEELGG